MSFRKLPVYLMIDCSESMVGPAIESVEQGVRAMLVELRKNPYALETAFLSVITFNNRAEQIVPLTELFRFQFPILQPRPGTSLGAALQLLTECVNREVTKSTPDRKGDYKPLVFILTDGQPTDDVQPGLACLTQLKRLCTIYAIGCGEEVDFSLLGRISDNVIQMRDMSPAQFAKYFAWVSASIQTASKTLADEQTAPMLPDGCVNLEKDRLPVPIDARFTQKFLHVQCSVNKKPYLMRCVYNGTTGKYDSRSAHPLNPEFFSESVAGMSTLSSNDLSGIVDCPYCGNSMMVICNECGQLYCEKENATVSTCPKCGNGGAVTFSEELNINTSQG